MRKRKKKKYDVGISNSMMVDVLFILLIFFILVSNVKKDNIKVKATKVDKNAVSKDKKNTKVQKHVVSINAKNQIFIDNQEVKEDQISNLLKTMKEKLPPKTEIEVLLRPDANSNSSKLTTVLALLNSAGLGERIKLEVDTK